MGIGFSVCIPVRNEAAWIGRAIESVLAQSHQGFELVIGDNASDDDVASVVAAFDDPRIRFFRFDDRVSVNESFNRTVAQARCEWIVALSADDVMLPRCLERLAGLIESHAEEGISVAAGIARRVDSEGRPCDITAPGAGSRRPIGYRSFEDKLYDPASWLIAYVAPGLPRSCRDRSLTASADRESGFFRTDVGLVADGELAMRLAAYGPVAVTNDVLISYTVRGDSITNRFVTADLERGDHTTMDERAMMSALRTHREHRTVGADEDRAVRDAIARKLLQRAIWHRRLDAGRGRRAAVRDLLRAFYYRPRALASPLRATALLAVIVAPRAAIDRAAEVAHRFGRTLA